MNKTNQENIVYHLLNPQIKLSNIITSTQWPSHDGQAMSEYYKISIVQEDIVKMRDLS